MTPTSPNDPLNQPRGPELERIFVRIPTELKKSLSKLAKKRKASFNKMVWSILENYCHQQRK